MTNTDLDHLRRELKRCGKSKNAMHEYLKAKKEALDKIKILETPKTTIKLDTPESIADIMKRMGR